MQEIEKGHKIIYDQNCTPTIDLEPHKKSVNSQRIHAFGMNNGHISMPLIQIQGYQNHKDYENL